MLSVGEILKNEREKKGLSLSYVEKELKVREKFLKAIEENRWNHFSSRIYIIGIIKNYSKLLSLDSKKILAFFRREYEKKEEIKFKERVSSQYLTSETKKFALIGLILVFLLFFGYFTYQLKIYFSPPKVVIISPKDNLFNRNEKIKIVGKTEKEALITIFKERVYQNKDGVFEYDFPLKKGKNELVIEVVGANGKKTIVKKDFYKN